MTAGQAYTVTVVMLNTGNTTWNAHGDIGLAVGKSARQQHLECGADRSANDRRRPARRRAFTFQIVAPNTPGTYNFQWNMVQDGIEWFGSHRATSRWR